MSAYSKRRHGDSIAAHDAACEQFYPLMLPGELTWQENVNGEKLDLGYAIDWIAHVRVDGFRCAVPYAIQERWREHGNGIETWGDVTITAYNLDTNEPSEFYKNHAGMFVYGSFDKSRNIITHAIALWFQPVIDAILTNQIEWSKPRCRYDQEVIAVKVDELIRIGAIRFQYNGLTKQTRSRWP